MPNEYLVEIHEFISTKIRAVSREKASAEKLGDAAGARFFDGQLQELADIREFMTEHYDLANHSYY